MTWACWNLKITNPTLHPQDHPSPETWEYMAKRKSKQNPLPLILKGRTPTTNREKFMDYILMHNRMIDRCLHNLEQLTCQLVDKVEVLGRPSAPHQINLQCIPPPSHNTGEVSVSFLFPIFLFYSSFLHRIRDNVPFKCGGGTCCIFRFLFWFCW